MPNTENPDIPLSGINGQVTVNGEQFGSWFCVPRGEAAVEFTGGCGPGGPTAPSLPSISSQFHFYSLCTPFRSSIHQKEGLRPSLPPQRCGARQADQLFPVYCHLSVPRLLSLGPSCPTPMCIDITLSGINPDLQLPLNPGKLTHYPY